MLSRNCPIETLLKQCRICLKDKPPTVEFFTKSKDSIGGISKVCKPCSVLTATLYVATHRAQVKQRRQAYYQSKQEDIKSKVKARADANPEKARASARASRRKKRTKRLAYNAEHREERNAYSREYDATHAEEKRLYNQQYYADHPELFTAEPDA